MVGAVNDVIKLKSVLLSFHHVVHQKIILSLWETRSSTAAAQMLTNVLASSQLKQITSQKCQDYLGFCVQDTVKVVVIIWSSDVIQKPDCEE